jgi:predicted nucleic acid-binding protein
VIVVDASTIASMLGYTGERGRKARSVMGRDTEWAAPEYWKVEVFSVMRGLVLGGKITQEQALRAINRISLLGVDQVAIDELLPRMWRMKANISAYDAAYVALAELRNVTLVTSDARLARAATSYCRVELVG